MDEIQKYLKEAIKGFTIFRDYQNLISCNLKLGELKLSCKKYIEAKSYAQKADEICRERKESYFVGDCVSLLDRVNEHIRATSLNVFVFLKSFPLVDPHCNMHIGPITQKHNNFKEAVLLNMKNENKVIQVKFDVLTRESLECIKSHG